VVASLLHGKGIQVILDYREWTITVSLSNSAVRKDTLGG
jgi:hypothetical protein